MERENTYVVGRGDTLYGIAKKYNTSVQKLRELNNLNTDVLQIGDVLTVPTEGEESPKECVIYTVKKGDSLYSIAKKYNSTVDQIKRYNNLTSNNLSIGQRITIPCFESGEDQNNTVKKVSYEVAKGDSLYSIAKKFGTTVDQIKKDNNLSNNNLEIGQSLIIVDNAGVESIEECYGPDTIVPNDYVIYTVQKGDSLYSIAKKFGTTVAEIQRLNNLTTTALDVNDELKIPTSTSSSTSRKYTVQKGESLYSIAKKFNTTVDEIKRKNNLTSNLLSIGQVLNI
mgnify:CR=1 FL=1